MSHAQQPEASQRGTLPTNSDIDALVYELRQAGTDSTYEIVKAALSRWAAPAAQAVEPPQHQGMTIAGDGASELGQLMRKQWEARGGLYPDGNPNAGQP